MKRWKASPNLPPTSPVDADQLMDSQLSCLVAEPCSGSKNLDSSASDAARFNIYAERRPGSYISVEVSKDFSGDGHARPEGRPCEAARVSDADDALACDEGWVPCELVVGLADAGSLLLEDVWQQGRLCDAVKQQLGCSCCIVSRHLQMHERYARWEGVGKSRERRSVLQAAGSGDPEGTGILSTADRIKRYLFRGTLRNSMDRWQCVQRLPPPHVLSVVFLDQHLRSL